MSDDRGPDRKEIERLEKDVADARISAMSSRYWYAWGMMLGFLVLAPAEIGYLCSKTSKAKRVIGTILLTLQAGVVFIVFMVMSIVGR
jgi:hypothetical protein